MNVRFGLVPLLAAAGMSHGQVILVDYGESAAAPTLGGSWNTVDFGLSGAAPVDSGGSPTGVTINFAGAWLDTTVDQGPWPAGDSGWVDGDAVADYVFNTDDASVTFAGLSAGQAYSFEHVAARSLGTDRVADYMVNGVFADSVPNGDNFASLPDGWDGGNILVWDSVIADANGEITLSVTDVQGFGYVSASRLELIPAPGTGALLGLGGLMLARRRR